MNRKQKIVAVVVVIVLLGMLLYPPYVWIKNGMVLNKGFSFIFDPPHVMGTAFATVNTYQLFVQIITVVIVGGIVWYLLKEKK